MVNKNTIMKSNFKWFSPLGISMISFMVCGAVYTLVGTIGTVIYSLGAVRLTKQFYFGETIDPLFLGKSPVEILNESSQLAQYLEIIMIVAWSLSAGMGILQLGVAYFGLKSGHMWALWT
jgi:hypothetical protein